MYTYLDRPVTALDNSECFLLWAMRAWVHCRARRLCPPRTLRPAFVTMEVEAALIPFHKAMAAFARAGCVKVSALPDRLIGDDEALLLALFRDSASEEKGRVSALLARLLADPSAPPVLTYLRDAMRCLAKAGNDFAAPHDLAAERGV